MKKRLFIPLLLIALATYPKSVDYNGNPINKGGSITITPQTSPTILASYTQTINTAGLLDNTFGIGGIVNTTLGGAGSANSLVMQPDGKIVAVGVVNPGVPNFYLVRYNTNGSLDTSFKGIGIVSTPNTSNGYAAVLQPNGKIVAVGDGGGEFCLVRYNTDGSLDKSFNGGIPVTTPGTSTAYAVLLQPDGKIIALGQGGTGVFTLARYKTDGTLDLAFGLAGTGIVSTDVVHPGGSAIQAALLQPDGKIIAIGGGDVFTLVRYTTDGRVDSSFGLVANNYVVTTSHTSNAYGAVLQPNGKIIVVGDYTPGGFMPVTTFCLARYNSDGSLDSSFGFNGTGIVTTPNTPTAYAAALQPDGKIVVAGGGNGTVARYLTNGSLDTTFGSSGKGIVTTAGVGLTKAAALQSDNKIVIAGQSGGGGDGFSLARYINPFTLGSFTASYGTVGLL